MTDWTLIDHWVSDQSDEGIALKSSPSNHLALFKPDDHPDFDPAKWNTAQVKANCMAYSLMAMGERLQPGAVRPPYVSGKHDLVKAFAQVSHRLHQDISMEEFRDIVRMGVELDGLERVQDIEGLYKPDHYLVGLFIVDKNISGMSDFHFMRLDNNGYWSCAFYNGYQGVTFFDKDEERIKNPATANLNLGLVFDGFYHAPKGGAETLRKFKPSY